MTEARRRDAFTLASNQAPRLLLVSERAATLRDQLQRLVPAARDWKVTTCAQAAQAVSQVDHNPPDLIVLAVTHLTPDVNALFEHAKKAWPHTFFLLVTPRPHFTSDELVHRYGDMTVLCAPDPKTLCAAIERELTALSLGIFRGLSLPSLLQMMALDQKSVAILVYSGHAWGRLHLRAGELVNAYVHATGAVGETAAMCILTWEKVTLFLERSYHNQLRTIHHSLPHLLMEAMKQQDELTRTHDDTLVVIEEDFEDDMFFKRPGKRDLHTPSADASPPPFSDPPAQAAPESETLNMTTTKTTLDSALGTIEGATAAALVDYSSGMALAMVGSGINLEVAAAGNTDVVRAKLRTMESLGIKGHIEDILITLDTQYHVIYIIPDQPLFLYLVLQKDRANLAMARFKLKALGAELKI